jgi:hypothetical protein
MSEVTIRELIEMLEKWDQNEKYEVLVQNNTQGGSYPIVILAQKTNTIRLN